MANQALGISNERSKIGPTASHSCSQQLSNSQESYVSASSTAAAPRLQSSSSNVSNASVPETVLTSPTTSEFSQQQLPSPQESQLTEKPVDNERPRPPRPEAPGIDVTTAGTKRDSVNSSQTSPMAVDAPGLTHGSKRTASGLIKSAIPETAGSPTRPTHGGHLRTSSDSHTSRIGDASALLPTFCCTVAPMADHRSYPPS